MDGKQIIEEDKRYVAGTYARFPVVFRDGKGCRLYDCDGREYLDCGSGIGVNIFGVNDGKWKEAVTEQLGMLQHTSNLFYTRPQADLARLLCERTGADKVFFGNSGAEANECAIKAARKYGEEHGGRYGIITLKDSFHGRTIATLAATGQEEFHRHFGPFPEGFTYAEPTIDGVEACITDDTCAVMIEVIQGESGVNVLPEKFVKGVEKLCRERGLLLICDEVQSGNGRTGHLYSYMAYGVHPDIVTTAKGLGGGLPIGACMLFGDCAINISYEDKLDKDGNVRLSAAQQLAEVAVETAKTAKVFGIDPKVAMLSYSTKGSGKGANVDLVRNATAIAKEMAPDIAIDGEMQFDAAVSPVVGQLKFPGSKVAGYANTFIFPEIQSGNIGYKIAQRLGGFDAYGPILQGLNAPINDLSRGCNAEEVYQMSIITAALA